MERRRHDQVKELRLSARISANDLKTKAVQTERFLEQGQGGVAPLKSNDGVAQKLRPKAGAILYDEFRALLGPHRVEVEGKMIGPNHMIMQVVRAREKKGRRNQGGERRKIAARRRRRDARRRAREETRGRGGRGGERVARGGRALSRAAEGTGGVHDAAAAEAAVAAQAAAARAR